MLEPVPESVLDFLLAREFRMPKLAQSQPVVHEGGVKQHLQRSFNTWLWLRGMSGIITGVVN